jgi:hypothetical protein
VTPPEIIDTPLTDAQIALSKAVEALQKLPPGSLHPPARSLFVLYVKQAAEAIAKAAA